MARKKAKRDSLKMPEAILGDADVRALMNRILRGLHGETAYWIVGSDAGNRVNGAYNEGVAACEEVVVKILREAGFDPEPVSDDDEVEDD